MAYRILFALFSLLLLGGFGYLSAVIMTDLAGFPPSAVIGWSMRFVLSMMDMVG